MILPESCLSPYDNNTFPVGCVVPNECDACCNTICHSDTICHPKCVETAPRVCRHNTLRFQRHDGWLVTMFVYVGNAWLTAQGMTRHGKRLWPSSTAKEVSSCDESSHHRSLKPREWGWFSATTFPVKKLSRRDCLRILSLIWSLRGWDRTFYYYIFR